VTPPSGPNPRPASGHGMKLLIVGYGRMGQMVEALAVERGMTIASRIDVDSGDWSAPADVAIDFSTASALKGNFPRYVERTLPVVIGTTGWSELEPAFRAEAERADIGVVASANFSIGVNLFEMLVADAARLMRAHPQYGAWIHELHHAAKRDAPSGTALLLRDAMTKAGYDRAIDVSSSRAGTIPGTHTVGFDGPSDTIELTHVARDRKGFASGALLAAEWIKGRRGWFSMADVLKA
jgi:4-hydroxy-tetrahydrodipicolinate reductase